MNQLLSDTGCCCYDNSCLTDVLTSFINDYTALLLTLSIFIIFFLIYYNDMTVSFLCECIFYILYFSDN